jgi:hypothetical protein
MAFTEQLESVMERTFGSWLAEPPPPYAFEFSQGGIAWFSRAASNAAPIEGFEPIDPEALAISPMKDNVVHPEVLERAIARGGTRIRIVPAGQRRAVVARSVPHEESRAI